MFAFIAAYKVTYKHYKVDRNLMVQSILINYRPHILIIRIKIQFLHRIFPFP